MSANHAAFIDAFAAAECSAQQPSIDAAEFAAKLGSVDTSFRTPVDAAFELSHDAAEQPAIDASVEAAFVEPQSAAVDAAVDTAERVSVDAAD